MAEFGSKNKPLLAFSLHDAALGPRAMRQSLLTFCLVLVAFFANSRVALGEWVAGVEAHMGTEISVYLWHEDPEEGRKAAAAVFAEVARLDRLMSTYIDDSMLSHILSQMHMV